MNVIKMISGISGKVLRMNTCADPRLIVKIIEDMIDELGLVKGDTIEIKKI